MKPAQLTEVVSYHITENQNAAVQMQIQSMHEGIMLKNIPITTEKDFIITLLKTYELGFHQNRSIHHSTPHREKKTLPDVWSVSQETVSKPVCEFG